MNLIDQLDRLKASLQVPAVFKSPPKGPDYTPDAGMYGQPLGATPDFGLSAPSVPPVGDPSTYGGIMGPTPIGAPSGPDYGHEPGWNPGWPMAAAPPVGAPTGLDAMLQELGRTLHEQASVVPPVAHQPKPLTDSEALIPAGIGLLASLLGGHNDGGRTADAAMGAVGNVYGSFQRKHADEAKALDLKDQQGYFVRKGNAGVDAELAKMKYGTAASKEAAAAELAGKEHLLNVEGQQKIDLQKAKDKAAMDLFHERIKTLPEAAQAKYMGTFNAYKAMNPGATDEQASAYAMSEHYHDIATGNLANTQAEDIVKTRDARIAKIKSATGLDDMQAKFLEKRYENYDDEQAIKMALLKTQIDSLGLTIGEKRDKADPSTKEYEGLKDDFGRAERDLAYWTAQAKESNSTLNDIVKSATLSPGEKSRLQSQKTEAEGHIKTSRAEVDRIDSRMKEITKKRASQPAPSRSGGRPAPMGGNIPLDPMAADPELKKKLGGFAPQTAADVLAMLNGDV